MPILYWSHGALAVAVVLARLLPPHIRDVVVRVACGIGAGFGIALFLERRSGDAWRTTLLDPTSASLAGVAAAAAWVVAAVLPDAEDRWKAAALVGLGAGSLILFAETVWAIPALLFWSLTSLIAICLGLGTDRRGEFWIAIVLSDLCFAAGLIGHVVDTDTWTLPEPAPGRSFWFILAAIVLRAGVIPRFGLWRAIGGPAAPALPLLVGGAFVAATGVGIRPEPWAAVGLLVAGAAQAVWSTLERPLAPADLAGWPSAVGLALVFTAPAGGALVGSAAILAVAVIAIWPFAAGRAQPERGLVLTLAPLTAAFGALVYAAQRAFEVATTEGSVSVRIPWTVVAALIPLVMAVGALLGAKVGRERNAEETPLWPLAATWLLGAGNVALGLAPGALELPDEVVGSQGSFLTLMLVAIGAGTLAGWLWTLRHPDHSRAPGPEPAMTPVGPPASAEVAAYRGEGTTLVERMLVLVALVVGVATFAAVGWITVEGLSQGFL